jgi:pimeloyl-ACP methyl ester carboxylesterase
MATFGLVHGGFHGAWCWERLIPLLTERGHDAVAMDLPSDDPEATLADYVTAVVDALAGIDRPVVIVGHSMGGMVIHHVPRFRPVSRMVFVCPMVDAAGDDPPDELPGVPVSLTDMSTITFDGQVSRISPAGAVDAFYGRCEPADAEWAIAQLRPQSRAPAFPLVAPWPDVPSSLIVCTHDRARNPEYLRRVIAPRLGVTPIELPADHSPFLSMPHELADGLDELVS